MENCNCILNQMLSRRLNLTVKNVEHSFTTKHTSYHWQLDLVPNIQNLNSILYLPYSMFLSTKIPWLSFSYALSNCIFPEIFKGIHTMYFLVCTFYGQCILLHFYHKDNKFEFRNHTVWRKSRASHAINKFLEGCYIKLFVVKNVLFFFNPLFLVLWWK